MTKILCLILLLIDNATGLTIFTYANAKCQAPVVNEKDINIDECLPHETIPNTYTKIMCAREPGHAEEVNKEGMYVNIQVYDNEKCQGSINSHPNNIFRKHVTNEAGSSISVRLKADVCSTPLGENEAYSIKYSCMDEFDEDDSSVGATVGWILLGVGACCVCGLWIYNA